MGWSSMLKEFLPNVVMCAFNPSAQYSEAGGALGIPRSASDTQ